MRSRQTFRRAKASESLNESHARELAVRTFVLPWLKRTFGGNLLSVVVYGSTQLGVRKATKIKRFAPRPSDLDLTIVLNKPALTSAEKRKLDIFERAAVKLFALDFRYVDAATFKLDQAGMQEPFQVMYGKNKVEELLGKNYSENFAAQRKELLKKQKYRLRLVERFS
ncbi:MAG: hypothetical protein WCW44_05555 [archaeon]